MHNLKTEMVGLIFALVLPLVLVMACIYWADNNSTVSIGESQCDAAGGLWIRTKRYWSCAARLQHTPRGQVYNEPTLAK